MGPRDRRSAGERRRSLVSELVDAPIPDWRNSLPSLRSETVYVGLSAGSMVMAPNIGEDFVRWRPPTGGDETLGWSILRCFRTSITRTAGKYHGRCREVGRGNVVPAYAIDDQTAIKVVDGAVDVISGTLETFHSLVPRGDADSFAMCGLRR